MAVNLTFTIYVRFIRFTPSECLLNTIQNQIKLYALFVKLVTENVNTINEVYGLLLRSGQTLVRCNYDIGQSNKTEHPADLFVHV